MPDPLREGLSQALDAIVPALVAAANPKVPLRIHRALSTAYEQLVAAEVWYQGEAQLPALTGPTAASASAPHGDEDVPS